MCKNLTPVAHQEWTCC